MNSLAVVIASILLASTPQAQTLSAAEAKSHEGENATVCGKVVSERAATSSRGKPTFINLDSAYPHQVFTIVVWENDRRSVGQLPHTGSDVCVKGLIKDYHGVPEIVVQNSGQFSK